MSSSLRQFLVGMAVVAGLSAATSPVTAQLRQPNFGPRGPIITNPNFLPINRTPINPNPFIAPGLTLQQAAFNTAVLGNALSSVPPYAFGFNPYPAPVVATNPVVPLPSYPLANPYGATLGTDPYGFSGGYSLSTTGGMGYPGPWGGMGNFYTPAQGYLYGAAALTSAQGDFYNKIMSARMTREEVRRSMIETARVRLKWEQDYEAMRPGLQDYREKQLALDLRIARGDAPETSIISGRALNDLLRAIQAPGRSLNKGPNIPLEANLLAAITVTTPGGKGSTGLLRDNGKLTWPTILQDDRFKEHTDNLSSKVEEAVKILKGREDLKPGLRNDIQAYFKKLDEQVTATAEELSPQQYIEARMYLNKVREAIKALGDPQVRKFFDNTWAAWGNNVAELSEHMRKSGLLFAPAAPGNESAYLTLYQSLRAFEAGLQTAGTP